MSRKRKSRDASASIEAEDVSTGVPAEELLAEGSEEIEAAIVEAVEAVADDEPLLTAEPDPSSETLEAAAEGEAVEAEPDPDAEIGPAELPTGAGSMDPVQLKQLVEALIFASDKPLTVQRLRQLTRVSDIKRLEATLAEIATDYENRGLILSAVSGGYQFRTRPQFSTWVQQLIAGRPVRLSRAQLETLAIVAYRQPITRPEIDDIRGVDSSATLKLLMDRALIRVLGKKEEVGRPMLYGTTKEFLDFFSLGDLRELPTLREYSELTAESRKVMSDRLGIDPAGPDGSDPSGDGGDGGGGEGGDPNDGGPIDGGSSPADDGSPLMDASADDLREAVLHAGEAHSEHDAVSATGADSDAVSAAESDAGSAADAGSETGDAMSAEDAAPGEHSGVQLADGTGAVAADALHAADESAQAGAETFAEGSAQFAAVTDEQLATALAETIEPAPAGEGDAMLASDPTDESDRAGSEPSAE